MYDHYAAIYHLLLDRMRLHRSSYPLDKEISSVRQQQRRPSTVAENAINHPHYQQQLVSAQQHMNSHIQNGVTPTQYQSYLSDLGFNSNSQLANSVSSYSSSFIDNTSTSAESGLELDMDTNEYLLTVSKPPLTRRHTLTGMTGIPSAEMMLRHITMPIADSGHGLEGGFESHSLESNLDSTEVPSSLNFKTSYPYNASTATSTPNPTESINYKMLCDNQMVNEAYNDRHASARSPINFREGRRASDGLMCQDVIAFRQKLKDGMKAGGMLELRQEHSQLLESFSNVNESIKKAPTTHLEVPAKPQLGKRMSLPTNSIDLPPHKLLEMKKSIQLDHQLARGQELYEITHPFGALVSYEPLQGHSSFNNHPSLQRQAQYNSSLQQQRKQGYKQSSALHQQFQQMHIEKSNHVSPACMPNLARGPKHPPVTRQSSYKKAQQHTVMPVNLMGSEGVQPLPWAPTVENSNFLMQVANSCANTVPSTNVVTSCSSGVQHSQATSGYPSDYRLVEQNPFISQ